MNTIEKVVSIFAKYANTNPSRVYLNDKTREKIIQALQDFSIEDIEAAIQFASEHESMTTPDKFNLPYLFTPGKIDRWVWAAKKKSMRRSFEWTVPPSMRNPSWLTETRSQLPN
jgi:hypothetical protein